MRWNDAAIILSVRRHGENSAVARVLARQHGLFAGVIKSIHGKDNRGVIQPGNAVNATWQARLPEHLGMLRCEMVEARAAHIMQDAGRLTALMSVCAILEAALPERHPYPRLYQVTEAFFGVLARDEPWHEAYVRLEMDILSETGFGLDLTHCAATGRRDDLIYVSPKSGRAVSREAGEPYQEKLLPLPGFLIALPQERGNMREILAGMRLTGYFLEHWLLTPHGRKLPAARARLIEIMKETHGEKTPA